MAQLPPTQPDLASPVPGPGGGDMATGGMADMAMGGGGGNCKYPDGPYDSKQGGTLDPTLAFTCLKPGETSGAGTMMTVKDFFDCDGKQHNTNALLFDVSAVYCGPCNEEADEMEKKYSDEMWGSRGIVGVTLLLAGADRETATVIKDAADWATKHKFMHMYTCIGPKDSKIMTGTSIPFNVGVNPRNMKVETAGEFPDLVAMAKKNGAM